MKMYCFYLLKCECFFLSGGLISLESWAVFSDETSYLKMLTIESKQPPKRVILQRENVWTFLIYIRTHTLINSHSMTKPDLIQTKNLP